MTQQIINLSTNYNIGSGDTVRSSFAKINNNFAEIFAVFPENFQGNTSQQEILLSSAPGARDGDRLLAAFTKINDNFTNTWTNFLSEQGQELSGNILSAQQQLINLGAGPNTNTGDTVLAALDKVNKNFSNLYSLLGLGVDNSVTYGAYVPRRFTAVAVEEPTFALFSIASDAGITPSTEFQPIDLGEGPDTQTGDTVYEAFTKINENFAQLYQVLGPEGFDINANSIISNSINNYGNIITGNIFAYHNISTNGNILAGGYFYPNGASVFSNISANTNFTSIDSSLIPNTSAIYSIGTSNKQWQSLFVSANVVIDGAVLTTNAGQLYINGNLISGNYGNANVAAYLPTYTGNIAAGNIIAGYFFGNGYALTSLNAGSILGTVANANYSVQSGQANNSNTAVTAQYVTALTGTNVNVALGYVPLDSNATAQTAQYVTQAAQANITSVGTLTNLTVAGQVVATSFVGNLIGNISGNLTVTGANTQVLFNDNGSANAVSGLTFNKIGNIFTVGSNAFVVNGQQVGVNVSSFIPNVAFYVNSNNSIIIPVGAISDRPLSPVTGMLRFNSSSSELEWYTGAQWDKAITQFTLTVSNAQPGTGAQTIFPLPVNNATTGGTIVSINGILQQPIAAYSITGANVTFTEAPQPDDVIDFRIFTVTNSISNLTDIYGNTGVFLDQSVGDRSITFKNNGTNSALLTANGQFNLLGNINSTSYSTGQMTVTGGMGISGNVYVNGTLFAVAKSFLINHPTKPDHHLQYASLEGPENGVYIRGKLQNSKVIELPDYWPSLVDSESITVTITPFKKYQKLFVASIEDNKVHIDSLTNEAIECFYTVWAVRKDIEKLDVEYLKNG